MRQLRIETGNRVKPMTKEMTLEDELNILRNIPLFGGVEPDKLKLLAFASDRIFFKRGQTLFSEGGPATSGYVILSGDVDVYELVDGGIVRTCDVEQYSIIGYLALFSDDPRTTTAVAIDDVKALQITRESFQNLMTSFPGTMSRVMASLGDQIIQPN